MVLMRTSTAVSLLAALLLAGCGGSEKETGPDVSAEASAPAVASSEPPAAIVSPADNPLANFDRMAGAEGSGISSATYAQAAQQLFGMMDAEDDGNLTDSELEAGAKLLAQVDCLTPDALVRTADNDKDGKITLSEWMAYNNARFTRIDRNGDGVIDRNEWQATLAPPATMP